MKRQTEAFVETVLFCGKPMPSNLNRRYFPTIRDYSNIIYRSRMKKTHSVIDEENLIEKMHHWQISNPDDYFHFRQCSTPGQPASLPVDGDEDADVEMQSTKNGLLLVYQSAWQRKLLSKYGSICLLDATYKTMEYAVPLFFLFVKTNNDYCVAAMFVTQFEDASSVAEALQLINQWNPEWRPGSFIVDYREAEMTALEKVFPGKHCTI